MKLIGFVIFLISLPIYGQRDLSGIYKLNDIEGVQLCIDNNKLYYIDKSLPLRWYNDTLANCVIKWVNRDFIEITSVKTPDIEVVQQIDKTTNDIKLIFDSSYTRDTLRITILGDDTLYTFPLSKEKNEFILPHPTKKIKILIRPNTIIDHAPMGIFYGRLFYESPEFKIHKDINLLRFNLLMIDDSFFEKYFIVKEYIKVNKRSLIWKGDVYKK